MAITILDQNDKTELQQEIEEVRNMASESGSDNVPDYIVTEAERVAKAAQATRTAKSLVFPAMADMHLYAGNSNHENSLISAQYAGMGVTELKKRMHLDFIGYLGDYTGSSGNYTAEQAMSDITAFKETTDTNDTEIWCVGNHDLNYHSTSELLTLDEVYSHIGANADGVKPYADIERGYGYIDFENQKVRVIYLNTCDGSDWTHEEGENATSEWISPTQLQWLADTALDFTDKTTSSEWGIVVIGHHPLHYPLNCFNYAMKILEAYKDGTNGELSCAVCSDQWQTVTYDFSNVERAEIICNIHGHTHNCAYSKISSTTNGQSAGGSTPVTEWLWRFCIPNICATRYNTGYTNFKDSNPTAAQMLGEFDENGNPVEWTKETGTAKATSFCVVNIDRKNKKIYAHIFGAGVDRVIDYGEPTVAYTNQIPISTDADGNIYNGVGYENDVKLSSSSSPKGLTTAATGYITTGFIPIGCGTSSTAQGEQVVYLANIDALPTDANSRIFFYDADKNYVAHRTMATCVNTIEGTSSNIVYSLDDNGYIKSLDTSAYTGYCHTDLAKTAAYFRFCAPGLDGDSIITVNEPIV